MENMRNMTKNEIIDRYDALEADYMKLQSKYSKLLDESGVIDNDDDNIIEMSFEEFLNSLFEPPVDELSDCEETLDDILDDIEEEGDDEMIKPHACNCKKTALPVKVLAGVGAVTLAAGTVAVLAVRRVSKRFNDNY